MLSTVHPSTSELTVGCLLDYAIRSDPDPLTIDTAATVEIVASNNRLDIVRCSKLVITIPAGPNAADLTPPSVGVDYEIILNGTQQAHGTGVHDIVWTPAGGGPNIDKHALVIRITKIQTNTQAGAARLNVTETAGLGDNQRENTTTLTLTKHPPRPPDLNTIRLWAEDTHNLVVSRANSGTLRWNGPPSLNYSIQQAANHAVRINQGGVEYPFSGLTQETTFTLIHTDTGIPLAATTLTVDTPSFTDVEIKNSLTCASLTTPQQHITTDLTSTREFTAAGQQHHADVLTSNENPTLLAQPTPPAVPVRTLTVTLTNNSSTMLDLTATHEDDFTVSPPPTVGKGDRAKWTETLKGKNLNNTITFTSDGPFFQDTFTLTWKVNGKKNEFILESPTKSQTRVTVVDKKTGETKTLSTEWKGKNKDTISESNFATGYEVGLEVDAHMTCGEFSFIMKEVKLRNLKGVGDENDLYGDVTVNETKIWDVSEDDYKDNVSYPYTLDINTQPIKALDGTFKVVIDIWDYDPIGPNDSVAGNTTHPYYWKAKDNDLGTHTARDIAWGDDHAICADITYTVTRE